MLTPQQVAAKWQRNLAAAGESYKQGVQAVQTSPTELARRQKDRMVANLQEAVSSGRYDRGCQRVSLADWQNSAINKGATRLTSGAAAALPKVEAFQAAWLPLMEQAKAAVRNMPKGTVDDSLARVRFMMEVGRRFAGKTS